MVTSSKNGPTDWKSASIDLLVTNAKIITLVDNMSLATCLLILLHVVNTVYQLLFM